MKQVVRKVLCRTLTPVGPVSSSSFLRSPFRPFSTPPHKPAQQKSTTVATIDTRSSGLSGEKKDEADKVLIEKCGVNAGEEEEEEEMEEMFVMGPAGMEWGGPTRGGQRPEPTRFGDWERKGRASDF